MDVNQGQQLGYLIRAVEDLGVSLKEHMDKEDLERVKLSARLGAIEDEIKVNKAVSAKAWRVLGFIGAVVPLLALFKFSDVLSLWKMFVADKYL